MRSRLSQALNVLAGALLLVGGVLFSKGHGRLAPIVFLAAFAAMWIGPVYDRIEDRRLGNYGELPPFCSAPGEE